MVYSDDVQWLVKRLLLDAFPGMRFDVELRNPKYVRTSTYQSAVVTYHDEAAQERGITQRDMRRVLEAVLSNDEVRYGTKTFSTIYLTRLSFAKKAFHVQSVSEQRVQEIVTALETVNTGSSSEVIQRTVEVLAGFLPRSQQPLFAEVVKALKRE